MKKRLHKRITALVLTLVMLALAACGNAAQDSGSSAAESTGSVAESTAESTEQAPAAEELPYVKLKWYQLATTPADYKAVEAAMNEILLEKINAEIEIVFADPDYDQKMMLAINSGEEFDIMFTCSWTANYYNNAKSGAFVRLDDPANNLLEQYGQDMVDLINPNFFEGAKVDGGIYAIPVNKELAIQPVWNVNVDVAEKYGFDYETILSTPDVYYSDEFLEALKKVKEAAAADGDPEFRPLGGGMDWIAENHMMGYIDLVPGAVLASFSYEYGNPQDSDYQISLYPDTEEYKKMVARQREFYLADLIYKGKEVDSNVVDVNKTGKWLLDWYHYMPLNEISDSESKGYPVDVVPVCEPVVTTGSTQGAMNAISVTSKNPERAMMFLNLVNSDPELRQMLSYGIEGVHYTLDENDRMVRTAEQSALYAPYNFALGNVFLVKLGPNDPADKWDQFNAWNDSAYGSPLLGFNFDATPVINEHAALQNVKDEFNRGLLWGSVNPDEVLPKYVEKLKAAGADKYIAEVQRQVDEWLKTK
ncbi:MAG: ABC transporter substrate-binding protein [Clostridium sp.]|jgi:putative aldouronate transport system substrate-binding protein|nr:ABC transporter substrate-binding protein [Clostridium sp.]